MKPGAAELKALYVQGIFDGDDWMALIGLLRVVEQKHPEHNYRAFIVDGTEHMTAAECIEFLRKTTPERQGRKVATIFKRQ